MKLYEIYKSKISEASMVYAIIRKSDDVVLQISSELNRIKKEFEASPAYKDQTHYIKQIEDPQQAKAEKDPSLIGHVNEDDNVIPMNPHAQKPYFSPKEAQDAYEEWLNQAQVDQEDGVIIKSTDGNQYRIMTSYGNQHFEDGEAYLDGVTDPEFLEKEGFPDPAELLFYHSPKGYYPENPDDIDEDVLEDLRAWFGKGKKGGAGGGGWDRYNTKGERIGKCGDSKKGEGKPKCLSKSRAASLRAKGGKAAIGAAVRKKRREDPNKNRKGKAKNVSNTTRKSKKK